MRAILNILRSYGQASTYNPLKNYFLPIGFLTGLPAPVVSVWTHLYALDWRLSVLQLLAAHPFHWVFMAVPLVFALIFGGLGAARIRRDRRLSDLVRRLSELSTTDELTGLSNARHFQAQLDRELERAERNGGQFSLVLFDLDGFKVINDTRGHPNGDVALREVARLIRSCRRRYDTVVRYGGDEFALILAGAKREDAIGVAERLRTTLMTHGLLASHEKGPMTITASFGVAAYPDDGTDKAAIVAAADRALYLAKTRGRNRVCSPPDGALQAPAPPAERREREAAAVPQGRERASSNP